MVVENTQNNKFVIFVFFKKKIVNISLNNTIFDGKKLVFKNPILNMIKFFSSIV